VRIFIFAGPRFSSRKRYVTSLTPAQMKNARIFNWHLISAKRHKREISLPELKSKHLLAEKNSRQKQAVGRKKGDEGMGEKPHTEGHEVLFHSKL